MCSRICWHLLSAFYVSGAILATDVELRNQEVVLGPSVVTWQSRAVSGAPSLWHQTASQNRVELGIFCEPPYNIIIYSLDVAAETSSWLTFQTHRHQWVCSVYIRPLVLSLDSQSPCEISLFCSFVRISVGKEKLLPRTCLVDSLVNPHFCRHWEWFGV